jgi:hypothetical protein
MLPGIRLTPTFRETADFPIRLRLAHAQGTNIALPSVCPARNRCVDFSRSACRATDDD